MSLINGSLQIGQSALLASQAALQVVGNNIANASSPNYSREQAVLEPIMSSGAGQNGTTAEMGVRIATIQRMTDEAINARLRSSTSDQQAAQAATDQLSQVETVFNALGTDNLSTRLTAILGSFTTLANDPQSASQRQLVIQSGQSLAQLLNSDYKDLVGQRAQINSQLADLGKQANQLVSQIADLNSQITKAEFGTAGGSAAALLDQRDGALGQLSQLMNIQTSAGDAGAVNVYLGSTPLVMDGNAYGISVATDSSGGANDTVLKFASTGNTAQVSGGQIGGLINVRDNGVVAATDDLNSLASAVINEVNKLHTQGQGLSGSAAVTATNQVTDPNAPLNAAGLGLTPANGTFHLELTDATGAMTAATIKVDLDGIGTQTSLNSLANQINGVANVSAAVGADGRLTITAASGYTLSFSQDTGNVLAALGVNTFFSGHNAGDIAVRSGLTGGQIAAATNHQPSDASNALAIAGLANTPVGSLGGLTMGQHYQDMINKTASFSSQASFEYQAADTLNQALQNQQSAVSGVNTDEEAISMMQYQRAYEGAARYLSTINTLLGELMKIV